MSDYENKGFEMPISDEPIPQQEAEKKELSYFNSKVYHQIDNKFYINGCSTKTAVVISQMAEKENIPHSIKYDGDRSVVTLDGDKKDFCFKALGYAKKQHSDRTVESKSELMAEWAEKAIEMNAMMQDAPNKNISAAR